MIDTGQTAEALGSIGKLNAKFPDPTKKFPDPTKKFKVKAGVSQQPAPPPLVINQVLLRTPNQ